MSVLAAGQLGALRGERDPAQQLPQELPQRTPVSAWVNNSYPT